jgi:hypothetical protein
MRYLSHAALTNKALVVALEYLLHKKEDQQEISIMGAYLLGNIILNSTEYLSI